LNRLGPVLIGSVVVLPNWVTIWTGCSPRLPLLGAKNRTELDLKTLAEKLATKEAAGGLVKKRKERSDKGKLRGSLKGKKKASASMSSTQDDQVQGPGGSEDDEDDEDEPRQPAKKKQKHAPAAKVCVEKKLPPAPKSRAFIADTDDEDDE
ncbi:hypothetical protein L208DRAFT_1260316, partial [Tricholoma matsutake]